MALNEITTPTFEPVFQVALTARDVARLRILIENACAEVDDAAQPDSQIQPDDPMGLMESYDWGRAFVRRLDALSPRYVPAGESR